jgi:hypothetical protein
MPQALQEACQTPFAGEKRGFPRAAMLLRLSAAPSVGDFYQKSAAGCQRAA